MKRLVTLFVLLAMLAGILAGCATPTPQTVEVVVTKEVQVEKIVTQEVIVEVPVEAPAEEAPGCELSGPGNQPYAGKELRILGFGGVPQFQYQNKLLTPQYEAISGVKVIWDDTPYPELFPKIEAMCGAKSDEYDIYYLEETFQGKLVEELDCAQFLEEMYLKAPGDSHPEDYTLETFSQMGMYGENWVGYPGNHAVGIMAYRSDLFNDPELQAEYKEKFGTDLKVPEDWEELLQVAQFFTRDTDGDGENDLWGLNHRYGEANNIFSDWLVGFALSRGLEYWDKNYYPLFNSEASIDSASFFLSPEYLAVQPPGAESYQFQEVMQNMSQGKVAMYITENWSIPLLKDPEATPGYWDKIEFAPVPGWKDPATGELKSGTMSAGIGYGVNKNISDEQKCMAWDYLQFAFGKTLARPFTYQTGVGTRLSAHNDPELEAKWLRQSEKLARKKKRKILPKGLHISNPLSIIPLLQ